MLYSFVHRPPQFFFVLWFTISIIHGSGRAQKTKQKKNREGLNTYRELTRDGRGGEGSTFKYFIIEHSNDSQDPRRSRDQQYSIHR